MSDPNDIAISRVGLSLPCTVPVVPGTDNAEAPLEERTECCSVDAWWVVGIAFVCHHHLLQLFGQEAVDDFIAELKERSPWNEAEIPNARETKPWAEMHRYEQQPHLLYDGHPLKVGA